MSGEPALAVGGFDLGHTVFEDMAGFSGESVCQAVGNAKCPSPPGVCVVTPAAVMTVGSQRTSVCVLHAKS